MFGLRTGAVCNCTLEAFNAGEVIAVEGSTFDLGLIVVKGGGIKCQLTVSSGFGQVLVGSIGYGGSTPAQFRRLAGRSPP